jgi:hypothetical protein
LLIGIVKKNGIMMVDFALEAERKHGQTATQAIYEASLLRFRPVMMTTMAALLGGIPLAFGNGTGSELRRRLEIAMIGGLLLSQALTLYTTPVIYIFFDRFANGFSGSGCEGRISILKRRHGIGCCRCRGLDGMKRWVGLGVLADNLISIGKILAGASARGGTANSALRSASRARPRIPVNDSGLRSSL